MAKQRAWFPYMLVAFLLISMGGNIYMVARAATDPSFAVEPDYYRKAVDWDRRQAQQAASDALGWTIVLDARQDELRVQLRDRFGRPIDGAMVRVEAFANARAQHRSKGTMVPKGHGVYVLSRPFARSGLWEYRLAAVVNEKRFMYRTQRVLP